MNSKLLSGKWLLTVACAIVFMYCSFRSILPPSDIKEIIRDVVVFYFVVKGINNNNPKGGAV